MSIFVLQLLVLSFILMLVVACACLVFFVDWLCHCLLQLPCHIFFLLITMPGKAATSSFSQRARIADLNSSKIFLTSPSSDRITDRSNRAWYEKKKNNSIKPERTFDLIFDTQLEISNLFAYVRWGSMIIRSGADYPSLGKDFYSNITQKNNKDLINIKTTVKGVDINLD